MLQINRAQTYRKFIFRKQSINSKNNTKSSHKKLIKFIENQKKYRLNIQMNNNIILSINLFFKCFFIELKVQTLVFGLQSGAQRSQCSFFSKTKLYAFSY